MCAIVQDSIELPGMPNDICNVIAEYSGSVYAGILIPLGSDDEFRRRVRECHGWPNKQQLAAASQIMKILIAKIGVRTSKKYTRREIHRMISNIDQHSVNPDFATGVCQYRVFYRTLLTYFT